MGVRFNLVDQNGEIPVEEPDRFEGEGPVINMCIKLNSAPVYWLFDHADQLGIDGDELQELLGYTAGVSGFEYGSVIDGDDQQELFEMCITAQSALEKQFSLDAIEAERDYVSGARQEKRNKIGSYRYEAPRAHAKVRMIADQIAYALERQYTHRIG